MHAMNNQILPNSLIQPTKTKNHSMKIGNTARLVGKLVIRVNDHLYEKTSMVRKIRYTVLFFVVKVYFV